jgi:hypothetical protein
VVERVEIALSLYLRNQQRLFIFQPKTRVNLAPISFFCGRFCKVLNLTIQSHREGNSAPQNLKFSENILWKLQQFLIGLFCSYSGNSFSKSWRITSAISLPRAAQPADLAGIISLAVNDGFHAHRLTIRPVQLFGSGGNDKSGPLDA